MKNNKRKLTFDEDELHSLLQIVDYWDDRHHTGTEVGAKIYKFFGYRVTGLNLRDEHWWVEKGDFKSYPFKATNGSICSDAKTLEDAIRRARESNESEGLEKQEIEVRISKKELRKHA